MSPRLALLGLLLVGCRTSDKARGCPSFVRRLHSIMLADKQGHWELACLLEELPSAKSPDVHQVVVKDLVSIAKLIENSDDRKKGAVSTGNEDDD